MLGNHPHATKASMTQDPDIPLLHEVTNGEHRDDFLAAMDKNIKELEQRNTWKVVKKTSIPRGANLLPSNLAFKIKRCPDGRMRTHKARFCVRGDRKIKKRTIFSHMHQLRHGQPFKW